MDKTATISAESGATSAQLGERSERIRLWWARIALLVLLCAWLGLVAVSWAEASDAETLPAVGDVAHEVSGGADRAPAAARASSDADDGDEYSFSWLDPDKKIHVLQNRRYRKALHPQISVMGGVASNDPYRSSYLADGRATFYFTEDLGIEVFGSYFLNSENQQFENLTVTSPNALPSMREVRAQFGGLLQWAPWYAKINVFNQVLYFDWYLSGGAGLVQTAMDARERTADAASYTADSRIGFMLGTGHQYHLNEWLKFRLDFTTSFFRAAALGIREGDEVWFSNSTFVAGLGVRL